MAKFNRNEIVRNYLKERAGEKFTARNIAEWLASKYADIISKSLKSLAVKKN